MSTTTVPPIGFPDIADDSTAAEIEMKMRHAKAVPVDMSEVEQQMLDRAKKIEEEAFRMAGFSGIRQATAPDHKAGDGLVDDVPTTQQLSHMRSALEAVAKILLNLEQQGESLAKFQKNLDSGTMLYMSGGGDFGRNNASFQMPTDIIRPFSNIELRLSLKLLAAVYKSLAGVPILAFSGGKDPQDVISEYLQAMAGKLRRDMEND